MLRAETLRLIAGATALALAGCTPPAPTPAGYPPQYEVSFMRGCEGQNPAPGVCACIWDRIEAEVPPSDFAALDRMPGPQREAHPLMDQINGYALACRTAREPAAEPPPAP